MLSVHGACREQLRKEGTKRKKARGKSFPSPSSKKLNASLGSDHLSITRRVEIRSEGSMPGSCYRAGVQTGVSIAKRISSEPVRLDVQMSRASRGQSWGAPWRIFSGIAGDPAKALSQPAFALGAAEGPRRCRRAWHGKRSGQHGPPSRPKQWRGGSCRCRKGPGSGRPRPWRRSRAERGPGSGGDRARAGRRSRSSPASWAA